MNTEDAASFAGDEAFDSCRLRLITPCPPSADHSRETFWYLGGVAHRPPPRKLLLVGALGDVLTSSPWETDIVHIWCARSSSGVHACAPAGMLAVSEIIEERHTLRSSVVACDTVASRKDGPALAAWLRRGADQQTSRPGRLQRTHACVRQRILRMPHECSNAHDILSVIVCACASACATLLALLPQHQDGAHMPHRHLFSVSRGLEWGPAFAPSPAPWPRLRSALLRQRCGRASGNAIVSHNAACTS